MNNQSIFTKKNMCSKCGGQGTIGRYSYYADGVCFKCKGCGLTAETLRKMKLHRISVGDRVLYKRQEATVMSIHTDPVSPDRRRIVLDDSVKQSTYGDGPLIGQCAGIAEIMVFNLKPFSFSDSVTTKNKQS
jgi:hypothetical protein